jgi:FkbM family methyltransferase
MNNYYSQCQQDQFLNEVVFGNRRKGFFIDIGAHDGKTLSNSLFFEESRGWDGICIEPNPNVFTRLNAFRKSRNLNVCVGDSDQVVKFTQIEGYAEMLSGITASYDPDHSARIEREVASKGGRKTEIDIQMLRLNSIPGIQNQHIDFMSIDTEGSEFRILSSINLKDLDLEAIVIENNNGDRQIADWLSNFGFVRFFKLAHDDVYVSSRYLTLGMQFRLKLWEAKSLLRHLRDRLRR